MRPDFTPPSTVYGVVSAAGRLDGQEESWVSRGVVSDDSLRVDRCAPVTEWVEDADLTPPTLTALLASLPETAAVGLDFPFGLPNAIVAEDTWCEFLRAFPSWCDSPADLERRCAARVALVGGSSDARLRSTDVPLSAVSPFDERLAASTFYGLRDVLRPLVLTDTVRVPPMTAPSASHPLVLEVYPAGTLADLDVLVSGYTEGSAEGDAARNDLLDGLAAAVDTHLTVDDDARARATSGASPLESVVAVAAVYRNTRAASALTVSDPQRVIEGQVYV